MVWNLEPRHLTGQHTKMPFRWQCSKLGNTQEQYFHQCRSFYFYDNVDNIDSNVTQISQCATMLNYGEPHILELMKNTLHRRLYPILFPINKLRDAITTAKRVMIKEIIDKQKTGHSPATPFMWMNECGQTNDRSSKKGVTFDTMETLERHSDSIDRLTSLVIKMNVKMDKKEATYKPRVYTNRPRGHSRGRQQNFHLCNRSFSRDRNRTRGNYNYRNNRPNFNPEIRTDVTTEDINTGPVRDVITTDRTIGGEIAMGKTIEIDKTIEGMTLDKETGVKVEID